MEQKTSNFQVIILIIFGFFIVIGVILFATAKMGPSSSGGVTLTPVTMWGTLSREMIDKISQSILEKDKTALQITYVQKDPETFEKDLIEAIADGAGPDVVILPQDMLLKNLSKFAVLPYSSYSLRAFKDQFIDASSVFLKSDGILAMPYVVDPLVMYWNKTHFVNAGIVNPPKEWSEFTLDVAKLTKKDSNFNISQSGTALGEYQNILHAKDILSMLFLQVGIPIVSKDEYDLYSSNILVASDGSIKTPASVALSFYTDFANTTKDSYSWNKSLKSSFDSFISTETSTYFGFASELPSIPLKNPNLNFDVAPVPQVQNTSRKSVFARIYGLAVLKSSKNQASAFNQIFTLTSNEGIATLSSVSNLPPVRKDVLASNPADPYMQIFSNSALIAETWPDPSPVETETMFKNMIESVITGKSLPDQSVSMASNTLGNIIYNNVKIK